jgi:L-fuculokinase
MCLASRKIVTETGNRKIAGITVTTFGVDGTFVDRSGKLSYPVISWQCERTSPVMATIGKYISIDDLYEEAGVFPFAFNTINKIIWFLENKPDIVEKSHMFLFMPSIFAFFLTGEMVNDMTMAGTSMMTGFKNRYWSEKILSSVGFPADKLGKPVEPGTVIGKVSSMASLQTSIPEGVPVVATGHDTQFAIFGSGAKLNEPVLSSGTWEILMARSKAFCPGKHVMDHGITAELDVKPGWFDIGTQWLASGILEWCRRNLYNDIKDDPYEVMISGAEKVPSGSNGIRINSKFYEEVKGKPCGQISGLTLLSTRDEIYRAMLETLAEKLMSGKKALEKAGSFNSESIICVGGGSKNRLWNQLRANSAGVPLKIIAQNETTVLGASFFVQSAIGNAGSPEQARNAVNYKYSIVEPR